MTVAAIRQDIKDVLDDQSQIGNVYDYERFANDWDTFIGFYRTTVSSGEVIRGWEIAYRGFDFIEPMSFSDSGHRQHRFEVIGYYQVDDANESAKTAANQAETICNAFNADTVLHGSTYYETSEAYFELAEYLFGDVLCHRALIPLDVTERAT